MEKYPTKKLICLLAQIVVTPAFCQPVVNAEGLNPPIRSPVMSFENQSLVRREPKVNPEWTWMTGDHATHILKSLGHLNVEPLEKHSAHWQGIVTKGNGQPSHFFAINRYGEVSTFMGSDIVQRWPMFSSEEVLALKDRQDLIQQIHVKYEISSVLAASEVESFLKERGF